MNTHKVLYVMLCTLHFFTFSMDVNPRIAHQEYENTIMHLSTIKDLYQDTHYRALLEYTRRFIEHPEEPSFVDLILKRLQESEEQAVVVWAWEQKSKSLLDLAIEVRKRTFEQRTLIYNAQNSSSVAAQFLVYANKIYQRSIYHETLLVDFNTRCMRKP